MDNDCRPIIKEDSLIAINDPKPVGILPMMLIVSSAAVLFLVMVVLIGVYLRRCRSKPSRVSSDAGTDV